MGAEKFKLDVEIGEDYVKVGKDSIDYCVGLHCPKNTGPDDRVSLMLELVQHLWKAMDIVSWFEDEESLKQLKKIYLKYLRLAYGMSLVALDEEDGEEK